MSKIKKEQFKIAKKKVKKYISFLTKEGFPVDEAYIFGSFARGDFRENSDIDVCIVSPRLRKNWNKNESWLWTKTRFVDSRIEPLGYSPEDFKSGGVMADTIKEQGVRVV